MRKKIFNKSVKFFISSMVSILFLGHYNYVQATIFQNDIQQNIQSYVEFKGLVMDSKTKSPLVYADLSVNGTNISTITNTEGKFLLKVPKNYLDKKVTISFLGYHKQQIPLLDFKARNTKILLNVLVTKLTQVNVNNFKDAETLVRETLKRRGENYYSNQAIMTAFYRETIKKRNKNASLSEAVVEVYKQPCKSSKKDDVKLIKARKSTNYSKLDTLALKLQGGPFSTLYADVIKYPDYIFTENNLSAYDFNFDTSTQINDNVVYVVNFKQLPNIQTPLYYGKLYIDAESLALTSAVYKLNVENKKLSSEMFVRKKPRKVTAYPTEASYRVDYKTKNGKWHYGYSNIQLTFKVKWETKLFSSTYTLNSEMVITDWEQNTTGIDKPKDRLKPTVILSDEVSGFSDPEFWGEYNIIEPEKSIESAIKKISKQLKRNGA